VRHREGNCAGDELREEPSLGLMTLGLFHFCQCRSAQGPWTFKATMDKTTVRALFFSLLKLSGFQMSVIISD